MRPTVETVYVVGADGVFDTFPDSAQVSRFTLSTVSATENAPVVTGLSSVA
jgi:hypothetical protein